MSLSVVIPVAEGDQAWKELLPDLSALSAEDEIIFCSVAPISEAIETELKSFSIACSYRCVLSPKGRAIQLNKGAQLTVKEFIWFLHCDSKLPHQAISKLKKAIDRKPEALHFFDLRFKNDGPRFIFINDLGVWFRSRVLRLPFGDQGLCIKKSTFLQLGRFCEKAAFGEDHLFVWKAHQNKIELNCVGEALRTSARRYATHGWAQTTLKHLSLTTQQAIPEFIRLIKSRIL